MIIIVLLVGEALASLIIAFVLPRPYRLVALIVVGAAIWAWETDASYTGSLFENGGDWSPGLDTLSFSAIVDLALLLPLWMLGAGIGIWLRRRWNRRGPDGRRTSLPTA